MLIYDLGRWRGVRWMAQGADMNRRETSKVGWMHRDLGSLSLITEGLIMPLMMKGHRYWGESFLDSVFSRMSLGESHTF